MKGKVKAILITMMVVLLSLVQIPVFAAEEPQKKNVISETALKMNLGETFTLTITNPDKTPVWTSSNDNVVSVNSKGELKAQKIGKATIKARMGYTTKSCVVTVVNSSLKINKSEATIYCGDKIAQKYSTLQLKATSKGAYSNVIWTSKNPEVAKVDEKSGKIEAVSEGKTVITATANGLSADCTLYVKKCAVNFDFGSVSADNLQVGTKGAGRSYKIKADVVGPTKKIIWSSSDKSVATVSGGKVTGKKNGTVTITAEANGAKAECKVNVIDGLVAFNEKEVVLYSGINPADTKRIATNASKKDKVDFKSSDENVVTIKDGIITAVSEGNAVVTAVCDGKTDYCYITVKETATEIANKKITLRTKGENKTAQLDYSIVGKKLNGKWSVKPSGIVSVSKGKLTAKKEGTATVTLKANGKTAAVVVTVLPYEPTISLDKSVYTLYTGKNGNKVRLKATVDGPVKKAVWTSTDEKVATVDKNGNVVAQSAGKARIRATANGKTAGCTIVVKKTDIIIAQNTVLLNVGEKQEIGVDIIGASQNVSWKSYNSKVAKISKGIVTGVSEGTAKIKATANGVSKEFTVVVTNCEHEFEEQTTVTEATCEKEGLITHKCKKCGKIMEETIPVKDHEYTEWITETAPTAEADGKEVIKCKFCGAIKDERIIPHVKGDFKLVWQDNFDGNELNTANWGVELHDPGWVNNEKQAYVNTKENIYVEDGKLILQALKTENGYTSGRVNTQDKRVFKYGRFEARAKVPSGQGFLPAFWMMPNDENLYGQWPKCGEIDIMEVLGSQTNKSYSTLHFGEPHTERQGSLVLDDGDFADEFHVFACEWEPGNIKFFVDDNLVAEQNDWFTKKQGFGEVAYPAPFDQPFYMILNVAVGGNWPGDPTEATQFGENARLTVDYVRVYQKDSYDENVKKPEKEVVFREADETGNYIINGNFTDKSIGEDAAWNILFALGGEGKAYIKNQQLITETVNEGTVDYSVQIVQPGLPMVKGCDYKLTFDAYASENRTMKTGITAPDNGYIRYLNDTVVELTTEKKSYEYTFTMNNASDANGRLEFNLGAQGSKATVYISNVRLEKIADNSGKEEVKTVLPDGNHVYNSDFNQGADRLDYWTVENNCDGAKTYVTNENNVRMFAVEANTDTLDSIKLKQDGLALVGGKEYVLSFKAYADSEKTIKASVAGFENSFKIGNTLDTYKFKFKTADGLAKNSAELVFNLGINGKVYLDDIRIDEDGLLINGDFSNGVVGYEFFKDGAATASWGVDSLTEKNVAAAIDISDTGSQDWHIQLKQNNITLEKGQWYKISLRARADKNRKIMYALQRDGSADNDWTPYSGSNIIELTSEYQTFDKTFEMTWDTDERTILSISMGAVGGTQITDKHHVYIDDIVLEKVEAPKQEEITQEKNVNLLKNPSFANNGESWDAAFSEDGEGTKDFAENKVTFNITNVGKKDFSVNLKQGDITLINGNKYKVTFDVKSTSDRTVKFGMMDPQANYAWYGGDEIALKANEVFSYSKEYTITEATSKNILVQFSLGVIEGKDTPASTIEISNVSLVNITGVEEPKPEEPKPVEGNLITSLNGFTCEDGKAEVTNEGTTYKFDIKNPGTADWHVQLKQEGLTLEPNATYRVRFEAKSTEARKIKLGINDGVDYEHGKYITCELVKDTIYTVDEDFVPSKLGMNTDNKMNFQFSLGEFGDTPASVVEIKNVSLVKVADGEEPKPEEPETLPEGNILTELYGYACENGKLANDVKNNGNNSFVFDITDVGTADHMVALEQKNLKLEVGAKYQIKFKIKSTKVRDVKVCLIDDKYEGYYDVVNVNNEYQAIDLYYTPSKVNVDNMVFKIAMGKVGDSCPASTIEISNVSLVKVEDAPTSNSKSSDDDDKSEPDKKEESQTEETKTETETESESETETDSETETETESETESETETSTEKESSEEAEA